MMDQIKQKRILLIDDNAEIHKDFRKILSRNDNSILDDDEEILFGKPKSVRNNEVQNYIIDSAQQGQEGLTLVENSIRDGTPYSLAFVDISMPPGWDGVETIKRIWQVDPLIQIVICSAYSEYSWDDIINELGNSDSLLILKKPFEVIEILQLTCSLTKKWELVQQVSVRLEQQEEQIEYFYNEVDFLYHLNKLSQHKFSLKKAFQFYIDGICKLHQWPLGHIYRVVRDQETQEVVLKPSDIWFAIDEVRFAPFKNITSQTTFAVGEGLPGRVVQSREPCWIEDVSLDDNFPRAQTWLDLGVHGALGVPIILGGEIIAVAEFFSTESMTKNPRLLDLTDAAANQLGLLLERRKNEKTLEANYLKLETLYEEMKNTQAQLLQHSKLVSIGQLAAGVAHEINNPIAYVAGNAEILQNYCETYKTIFTDLNNLFGKMDARTNYAEVQQYWDSLSKEKKLKFITDDGIEIIKESLEGLDRVRDIVADLKSFSHVNDAEMGDADINQCIDITLKMIWNELKYKCTVNKKYEQLPVLHCFPRQLNQVFMNLLVNAGQAITEKGDINITTCLRDNAIHVSIQDTGDGIKPENLESLFSPFFTTKPIGQGTGLGLSISYNIIQKHGGEITVDSEVGKGTTFTIVLPLDGVQVNE